MLKKIDIKDISVTNSIFRERMELDRRYLMELDTTALLQNFYLEAGVIIEGCQSVEHPEQTVLHWGWESPTCQLRGHFLGHWLSAAAVYIASNPDGELRAKLDRVLSELERCQKLNGGEWLAPIPEKYFKIMESDVYIWSPQYVMHKLIMGLTDCGEYLSDERSFGMLSRLADWYVRWLDDIKDRCPNAVFDGEQAGMLEVWARLYGLTKDKKYLDLANAYSDQGVFRSILDGNDALSNDHANASIPMSHGSAKMYEITGDEKWRTVTEGFWKNAVDDRGYFCTGGMNAGEFWIPPHRQGHFLSERDQEFCTVYNMVRTADYLFKWTGDVKYADYIERALYNGFLAQQNRHTGMPAYFLPLISGGRKKWGSKRNDFWCCHGTMVQAQTLYPDLIYYLDEHDDKLLVSQYIPSRMSFDHGGRSVTVEQSVDMQTYNVQMYFAERGSVNESRWALRFDIHAGEATRFTLSLRVPWWCKGSPVISINGEPQNIAAENGFISIDREWSEDVITLLFPSGLSYERLPDLDAAAVMDGPIVLAGLTDRDCGLVGGNDDPESILFPQQEHIYSTFQWKQNNYVTTGQRENFTFIPLYEVDDESYTVYFSRKQASE